MAEAGTSKAEMVLIRVEESYWLLEGETHIDGMLSGLSTFPTPVLCVAYQSQFELTRALPQGVALADLWGINPDIVERLRKDGHLIETNAPA